MHDQNLSMISWAKACMMQYMFRTRVFTRVKPEIEHFRLFGCPMYFHVPKEKNSKLDPLERKDTVNLQRHSRSTSLIRDRLRQAETLSLNKRYSCVGFVFFLVPDKLNKKIRCLSFRGSHLTQKEQNHLRKKKNRTIMQITNATKHDQNLSRIPWEEACMTQYMCRTRVFTRL